MSVGFVWCRWGSSSVGGVQRVQITTHLNVDGPDGYFLSGILCVMLSVLDEQLIRLASQHKSPKEIGRVLNLPADEVLFRINEILESRDVYDARQLFLLYLDDLYDLKNTLQETVRASGDQQAVSNLVRVLDQLGKALDKASSANRAIGFEISEAQTALMVRLIVQAFEYAKEHSDASVPWAEVEPVFREGLMLDAGT